MGLSIEEQEMTINASRDEDFATLYASDTMWITKMDKMVKKAPELFEIIAETDMGKTYRFPKRLVSIRSTFRTVSEEQKQKASERFIEMHKQGKLQR